MFSAILKIWESVSNAGTFAAQTKRERKSIVVMNRAWLLLLFVQVACLISHVIHGLHLTATLTAFYIAGLVMVHILMRMGRVNPAKICAIGVINYNTIIMGIFLGHETHIIDFLLLSALMPLYLFEIKFNKMVLFGMLMSIIPYGIYHYSLPLFDQYALPVAEQLDIYKTTPWVLVFSLSTLLYLIYQKNGDYEKEVHETEQMLISQKQLYERMLEQIPIDIVTFDKDLRYSYINSAAIKDEEMRRWMIGKTNTDYFVYRNLDVNKAYERDQILKEAMQKGKKVEMEETFTDRHGRLKTTIKGASPVYSDDKKELLCVIGYSLDISNIKEAERTVRAYAYELERKNEDLQHFVNATCHDLKSPLRNISSYLQLLEKKNIDKLDADSLDMVAFVVKSVKHLNRLISDIYQYSVADRSDKPSEISDLNKVLEDVLKQASGTIEERNATINAARLPVLKVAHSHMGMVFSNLIGNAIKYNTSNQPRVTIGCKETQDEFIISVSDNGIGISKEYDKQIFEIFKRLHTADVYEGTGVGLAICKKITENYGGRIWVESQEGNGSTFFFSLAKAIVCNFDAQSPQLPAYNQLAIAG